MLWYSAISIKMKANDYGEIVFTSDDLVSLAMQGHDVDKFSHVVIDSDIDTDPLRELLYDNKNINTWRRETTGIAVDEYDSQCQAHWYMPDEYKQLDIAEHVLSLCKTDYELQRVGKELLLYQERNLFDLLKYLKYLVDIMKQHNIIWGVGRGSSVASYVLYLLGVHRINSLYYDLDPEEFLR